MFRNGVVIGKHRMGLKVKMIQRVRLWGPFVYVAVDRGAKVHGIVE